MSKAQKRDNRDNGIDMDDVDKMLAGPSIYDDTKKREQEKQIDILVNTAKQAAALFHSSDGKTWAEMEVNRHREIWAIHSRGFKQWLLLSFREAEQTFPGSDCDETAKIAASRGRRSPPGPCSRSPGTPRRAGRVPPG